MLFSKVFIYNNTRILFILRASFKAPINFHKSVQSKLKSLLLAEYCTQLCKTYMLKSMSYKSSKDT